MKVLNFGSLNIDLTFKVPHMVREGETLSSTGLTRGAGGKGANQSAAIAKAGVKVYHAGKIGADGQFLIDQLRSYGVNTDLVTIWDGPSGQAIIQLDESGRNCIILLGGGNKAIEKEEIDRALSSFEKGDYLVLQNEINNIDYLMRRASEKGMHILFNPAPFDESVFALPLELVDIIVVNETEGQGLAGLQNGDFETILKALVAKYPASEIILTAGDKGSYYGCRDRLFYEPIIPVKAEDTTGAGDTFIGFFLASKLLGFAPEESLKHATKASSIAVSRKGAMVAIPFKDEVF
ncbi:MAG: ribokinase [Spirochaetales bacterium]|nr:ribokinase [Spirochaetales bacterium]